MIRSSIRRPVAVTMVYVSVALLGVTAWRQIPIELLPDVSFPQLTLVFSWPGSSPETLEAFATSPLESAIHQVEGVEEISSLTREGSGQITVSFARDVDMEFVRLALMERVSAVEEDLPDGVGPIQVQPYVPNEFAEEANRPFLSYTYTGPFLMEALRRYLDDVVVPEILRIRGVSDVEVEGGRERLLEIELDPDRIAALGLRPEEVREAVEGLDLVREAGAVREGSSEWTVTIRTRPTSAADLRTALLPVAEVGASSRAPLRQRAVRLEDVARVRDTFQEPNFHFRIDGSSAIGFQIHKEYGTNTVRMAEAVKARVAELEGLNLPGSRLILQGDQSEEIRTQLMDLRTRALVAAAVIFLVLLAFFRSVRTAGIVFATIAFSVLISLNLIYFGGLSLNILTLMGLALGFGLIVDNSIVVLENIVRKRQVGAEALEAAERGARDVVLPILASTATTLIVFLPFLYLQGELRIYYLPLVVVVGLTHVASIFVAFTFIPSLAVRVLGRDGGPKDQSPAYVRFYAGLLDHTLRHPWAAVVVAVMCFAASGYLFERYVPRGQLWGGGSGAQRSWVDIRIDLPRGSDLERVDELTRSFEDRLARMPEVERFTTRVQGTASYIRVDFPLEVEFTAVPLVIEERLRSHSLEFTGAEVRVYGRGRAFYGGGGSAPNYRITLLGYNYDRLAEISRDLGARLQGHSRIREVDTNASGFFTRDRAVEFVAEIDRQATARHGTTVGEVVTAVGAHLRGGERSGRVMMGGESVSFQVRLEGYRQTDVADLREAVVATSTGGRVRLGELIRVRERNVLTSIRRENQQYERMVAYEFRGPRALGDVIRDGALAATVLPAGYSVEERTPWQISEEDERQMFVVLLVALGLIYMVTAGLFESLWQPLCVLLAVPMALVGVFLIFFYVDATFTREAYIGVIMMGGIVVNNAILLIDHINRVRSKQAEPEETGSMTGDPSTRAVVALSGLERAIVQGTLGRVRPILMTTATTVLGLLPLVLFMPAADATIWNALTYALIGGLLASTLFVLTVTPALYLLFERGWGGKERHRRTWVRVGVPLLLLASSVSACAEGPSDRRLVTQVQASDSAGVSRVRILDLFGLGIPEVTGRRIWKAEESELYGIRDAWIESDGSVLMADAGNGQVIRLSPTGQLVDRFGSVGEDPGEFAQFGLNWIDGSREGKIVVYDERLSRITEFSPEGSLLGTHRVAPPTHRISLQPVALLSDRRILATYGDLRRFEREGLARDTVPLLSIPFGESADSLAADDAMPVDTLGRWPSLERMFTRTPMGVARLPVGFANDFLYDGAGEVAAVSGSEAVDVRVFEGGRLTVTVEGSAPPRPVRAGDADAFRRDLAERAPDPALVEMWRDAPVNEVYPTLDRIVVTQEGSFWLGIHPEYREEHRTFVLFDRKGFPVGRLRLPKEVMVLAVRDDRVVVSSRSDLNEERIAFWTIE
ncbi:MAG: efflux RND transporter permease subunit [Longimicrobiales bacterium]|nr:efflux RND transporter permease subunit [Longimicrobiales bacterium]